MAAKSITETTHGMQENEQAALGVGMKKKAEEFVAAGGDIYAKA